jgi:hypothetical protein
MEGSDSGTILCEGTLERVFLCPLGARIPKAIRIRMEAVENSNIGRPGGALRSFQRIKHLSLPRNTEYCAGD